MTRIRIVNKQPLNIYIPKKIIDLGKALKFNFSLIAEKAFELQIFIELDKLSNLPPEKKEEIEKEMGININKIINDYNEWSSRILDRYIETLIK